MENYKLYITLAVLVFMSVSFLVRKISYGMTTMTCAIILALTGVIDVKTAYSGFSHNTTVLVATMMVVAGAISKTSLVARIRQKMSAIQGKNGFVLVLFISLFTMVLCQLIGQTVVVSIMLVVITTLDDNRETSQSRMLFLVPAIIAAWFGRFPIGMGINLPLSTNAYYEGLVEGHPEYLLGMFDILKVGLIPSIALTIYCLFAWRLIPKQKIDMTAMQTADVGQDAPAISKRDENIIFGVFLAVMVSFAFATQLGDLIYLIPAVAVLALIYTKVLTSKEAVGTLMGSTTWMVAGMLVVSSALNSSGAGEFVGSLVLRILGDNPSGLMVITVFCVATVIMTNFLSNMGTLSVMAPIAASTALAGGMNPKALVLVVFCSSTLAVAFPTGSASATMAYAIGGFNPIKTLKFTIPYLIIGIITLIFSANLIFPLYG